MCLKLVNPISYRILHKAVNTGSGELARMAIPEPASYTPFVP